MKIAITANGKDLSSDIDPRFGRAPYFIVVDPESMAWQPIENTQNLSLPQGAGIQAGKTVIETGATVLITGYCGPKAFKVLTKCGIRIITGVKGRVMDAVSQYNNGALESSKEANVEGHWV
ncbi:MAG: NifB/NifX family molybdenum-iron cluster-binding protein [Pseudomonadota bacterium]